MIKIEKNRSKKLFFFCFFFLLLIYRELNINLLIFENYFFSEFFRFLTAKNRQNLLFLMFFLVKKMNFN